MSIKKATHCCWCNTDLSLDIKPYGRYCRDCYCKKMHQYNEENKDSIRLQNRINKERMKTLTPKKPKRTQLTEEDKVLKRRKRHKDNSHRASIIYYTRKYKKQCVRPPHKTNKDFEIYIPNDVWVIDSTYYLSFDCIKDIPIEQLNINYWLTKELELSAGMSTYIKEREYMQYKEKLEREKCSYVKKDPIFGMDENGHIKFWPT